MKRLISALSLLLAILILVSCAESAVKTQTSIAPESTETHTAATLPVKTQEVDLPVISSNITRADLEKIPVADASMTEDQLRDIVVQYMLLEKRILWTVNKSLTYPCDYAGAADPQGNLHIIAGTVYQGMPYIPAHLGLESFMDLIDDAGVIDTTSFSGLGINSIMGNTCLAACYWAWARVTGAFPYVFTTNMVPANHCIPVGPYDPPVKALSGDEETRDICQKNGEQVMFESYALLKKADGLMTKADTSVGHVRMVRENAVVVRNPDGTINGEQSYVICLEQTSSTVDVQTENGTAKAYSGEANRYTFAKLFSTNYLPFTVPELAGISPVQEAKTWLADFKEEEGYASFAKSYVTSNYTISRVDLAVSDPEGKVLSEYFVQNNLNTSRKVELTRLLQNRAVRQSLQNGETYHITVTARLSNGETKIAYEGDLQCVR